MLATQPPGARAAAGKHKKEKAVTLKNKATSKEESVKPYVQDCLDHVKRIAIESWKHRKVETYYFGATAQQE